MFCLVLLCPDQCLNQEALNQFDSPQITGAEMLNHSVHQGLGLSLSRWRQFISSCLRNLSLLLVFDKCEEKETLYTEVLQSHPFFGI